MFKYSPSGDTLWTKAFESPPGQTTWPAGKAIGVGPDGAVHLAINQGTNNLTVKYTDIVKLELLFGGSAIEVNWPWDALGWRLEASSGLSLGNIWTTITNSTLTNRMWLPITNAAEFFRLVTP